MIKDKELTLVNLEIKKNYSDFNIFFEENRNLIYNKILDVFERLKKSKLERSKLLVTASIMGIKFDTDFDLSKSYPKILIESINPYFESIEDYETCGKIIKLYSELTKNNPI